MEKYYIPTIEEFHVDFEYEALDNKHAWIKINDFSNAYMYEDCSLYGVIKDLQNGKIRVKYLDREDIESEGWSKEIDVSEVKELFKDNRFFKKLNMREDGQKFYLFILDTVGDSIVIYFKKYGALRGYGHALGSACFNGKIKNKSELNKLMIQLGIK